MNERLLYSIFDPALLDAHPDEWGLRIQQPKPLSLGYATTLTPVVIRQAIARRIDLLVTHHDAWMFMRDEREACLELLARHKISHIWCHTPLDAAAFGTSAALLAQTGCRLVGSPIAGGDGRVGELPEKRSLAEIAGGLSEALSESPCRVYDAGHPVGRIAVVTGAGMLIDYLAEALPSGIDLYITGETGLYLLEYAVFKDVSVLVYSHNYTEILGTRNLAQKVAAQLQIKEVVRLNEPHF